MDTDRLDTDLTEALARGRELPVQCWRSARDLRKPLALGRRT